jgi:hypothetical protein
MRSRGERRRSRLGFESLEGRVALSGLGGIDDGLNHNRRDAVEVRRADDRVGHNAADDKLARHRGLDERANHNALDDNLARHSGKDDRVGHNAADDNLPRHGGKDDGSGHR